MFEFLKRLFEAYAGFNASCYLGSPVDKYFADNSPQDKIINMVDLDDDKRGFCGVLWQNTELTLHRIRDTLDDIAGVDSNYAETYQKKKM